MKRITYFFLIPGIMLFSIIANAQSTIRGSIRNEQGTPLEFASIFIKETGKGAIANIEGDYEIRLSPGQYTLVFQYLGYSTGIREINAQPGAQNLDVVLNKQAYELQEVEIVAGEEDPAYTVMRKAIAKADYHRNQLDAYETTVYIKGSGRLKQAPSLFRSQIEKEGLDSTTAFVTESVSRIEFQRPNKYKETVISIRTQGDDNNTSPNSYFRGSFYDDDNDGNISPLSRKAFAYYKFKLEGYFEDRGYNVNKIKVTPRSRGENVFEGYIYILEDYWSIHSLNLVSYYLGFENRIEQIYAPIQENVWMPVSFKFKVSGKILGFGFEYQYLATADDYKIKLNPDLDVEFRVIDEKLEKELAAQLDNTNSDKNASINEKLKLGEELTRKDLRKLMKEYEKEEQKQQEEPEVISERDFTIDSTAYKKDSSYWAVVRPIPLTKYEVKGYARVDSLSTVEKEEKEGKSKSGFSFGDIFMGYKFKTGAETSFRYSSILMGIQFNPVEGFSLHEDLTFTKRKENSRFEIEVTPRYAFARNKFSGTASIRTLSNNNVLDGHRIEVTGGRYIFQYNENKPINEFLSMWENLFYERNYIRLYEKDFVKVLGQKTVGKWKLNGSLEWAERYNLQNNTHQTWVKHDSRNYASNYPINDEVTVPLAGAETAFIATLGFEVRPWQKYRINNGKKQIADKTSPMFRAEYKTGWPIVFLNTTASFSQLDFTYKQKINLGARSNIDVRLNAGFFIDSKTMAFTDFKHFAGNQLRYTTADPVESFRLLDYYQHSTRDKYLAANVHYGFRKFLVTQIPAVWMLGMRENLFVNYLSTPTSKNYVEMGYSLDKIWRFFRLEAVVSFQDGKYKDFGVLIGISTELVGGSSDNGDGQQFSMSF
ncbi:MAG: carboxypeptidase-like regulatory domain-containing protein [Saprospiraceae bacterium]|nr:carboxypeptidase-like regulatory domain-containing protein [Saprospiraceae bacterium]MCB9323487.1 carboxypeptidase-like regulatory domain-containing protein [Lewinellaceae bacterium]